MFDSAMGYGASGADGARTGPAVLASAATGIVPFIERLGGDVDSIFGNSGLAPEMTGATTLRLQLSSFCRLFEQAAGRTGNDTFGLWFGNQFQPRDLGLWGYAAVSAPTVRGALQQLVDLFDHQQEHSILRLAPDARGLVRLEYRIEAPAIVERRQDAELSLGMFLNVIREGCGAAWSPEEVHFEHPSPPGWRDHERAFGAPVSFARPVNAIVFRPDVLDRAMPAADTRLMMLMRRCLKDLGGARRPPPSPADLARAAVRARLPDGCPALETVAEDVGLPAAAIRRDLASCGLGYRELVEDVRREMAMAYLRQPYLSLTEIAFLLGYSELSAFSRAVRRWTGSSPRRLREATGR
jgi:AraC-like DNA-binding protein